ncbi:transposase [Azohydromonas sp. G-1-1-14]|uniref:Transposase n=1 Tax=Azohydromonas caseinilytica TaxID=2728836 RepID=A0A848FFX0_9BURK|nr:transposase [Azohydromonas caseinilytica]
MRDVLTQDAGCARRCTKRAKPAKHTATLSAWGGRAVGADAIFGRPQQLHYRASPPAQCGGKKGGPQAQAIGRSRGGLSTKIHATVDALGNPTDFHLTPGQAHDLEGADALLPSDTADAVIAHKAYDAQARVIDVLAQAG